MREETKLVCGYVEFYDEIRKRIDHRVKWDPTMSAEFQLDDACLRTELLALAFDDEWPGDWEETELRGRKAWKVTAYVYDVRVKD